MTRKWNDIPEGRKDQMARLFDVMTAADDLVFEDDRATEESPQSNSVRIDDLYVLATRPNSAVPPHVAEALRDSPKLQDDLDHIVKQVSISQFDVAVAADTGAITDRESEFFHLRIRPTQRRPDQVYLVVLRKDGATVPDPRKLLARRADGTVVGIALPETEDGVSQLLLNADDAIALAIGDRRTILDII